MKDLLRALRQKRKRVQRIKEKAYWKGRNDASIYYQKDLKATHNHYLGKINNLAKEHEKEVAILQKNSIAIEKKMKHQSNMLSAEIRSYREKSDTLERILYSLQEEYYSHQYLLKRVLKDLAVVSDWDHNLHLIFSKFKKEKSNIE